jgi:hypothetical protein
VRAPQLLLPNVPVDLITPPLTVAAGEGLEARPSDSLRRSRAIRCSKPPLGGLATDMIVTLSADTFVCVDGPELPTVSDPHAEAGGDVLDGMCAEGYSSLRDSRIRGREGGLDTVSGAQPGSAGIFSKG